MVDMDEQAPKLRLCVATRDLQAFDLLGEALQEAVGKTWSALSPKAATDFLATADYGFTDVLIIAMDDEDLPDLTPFCDLIKQAAKTNLPVFLLSENIPQDKLDELAAHGVKAHQDYPIEKHVFLDLLYDMAPDHVAPFSSSQFTSQARSNISTFAPSEPIPDTPTGVLLPVQGISGGSGSSTFAVHLAQALALQNKGRVCLIDMDFQSSGTTCHLDLRGDDRVHALWSGQVSLSRLQDCVQDYDGLLSVLPAPETARSSGVDPAHVQRLLMIALGHYDFVILDMPNQWCHWGDPIFTMAQEIYCPLYMEERSYQAATRFQNYLGKHPFVADKLQFVLNRVNGAEVQLDEISEALNLPIDLTLPDGGDALNLTAELGFTLADGQPDNPYWQAVMAIAGGIRGSYIALDQAA